MSYFVGQGVARAALIIGFVFWSMLVFADEVEDVGSKIEAGIKAAEKGDYPEALKYFRPLAEGSNAEAQHNLAMIYRVGGHGIEKDLEESAKWFRLAADQGIADAQYYLGYMYDQGEGLQQDSKYAYVWYRKAAEQGHALAQINLGVMYANGAGVTQDIKEAYLWFHVAAAQGYDIALENKKIIEEALSAADLEQLQEKTREYFRLYVLPFGQPLSPHGSMEHQHNGDMGFTRGK